MEKYEEEKRHKWQNEILETRKKLEEPLLKKNEKEKTLKVNFDPDLIKLLREVKYFNQMELEVPEEAFKIFNKSETYRQQINDLDQIVFKYNTIITTLHPVEKPLVEQRIKRIDEVLKEGLEKLKWEKEKDIRSFITRSEKVVNDTYNVVEKMKRQLEKIKTNLSIMKKPLIERKAKPTQPDEFYNIHQGIVMQQHDQIKFELGNITVAIRAIAEAV